jgi:hypothetical protein
VHIVPAMYVHVSRSTVTRRAAQAMLTVPALATTSMLSGSVGTFQIDAFEPYLRSQSALLRVVRHYEQLGARTHGRRTQRRSPISAFGPSVYPIPSPAPRNSSNGTATPGLVILITRDARVRYRRDRTELPVTTLDVFAQEQ